MLTEHVTERGTTCEVCHGDAASQSAEDAVASGSFYCTSCHEPEGHHADY